MNRLTRYARFFSGRIGIAGACGFALLVFTLGFLVFGIQPLDEDVRTLQQRAQRLHRPGGAALAQPRDAADAIGSALDSLPTLDKAPDYLAQVYARAREQSLALESGEYHVVNDPEAGVTRYQIRLPVKGAYLPIRRFVIAAMDSIPILTLDEVSIRRTSVGARDVEARIQFSLLFAEAR